MTDFIVQFEYLTHNMTKQDIVLPQGVMAFLLLKVSNISVENERLARATCAAMTYENMKSSITKIFGDPSSETGESNVPSIKSEPVFKIEHEDALHTSWRGGWRGRGSGRDSRGRGYGNGSYRTFSADSNTEGVRTYSSDGAQKSNPVSKDGKVMRCFHCGSPKHFARFCTQSQNDGGREEIRIVLLNSEPEMTTLVRESLGMAVLDSACTRTVTGETWFEVYHDTLSDSDKALIRYSKADTVFRFGDGAEVSSLQEVQFPVIIGVKRVMIKANIVKNEIPLLLSKASMKRAQNVKLQTTSSGHYCIPLCNTLLLDNGVGLNCNIILQTEALKSMTDDKKLMTVIKLHRQFAHASKEKLCKLAKNSKDYNDNKFLNMIEKCCDSCEVCMKLRRPPFAL